MNTDKKDNKSRVWLITYAAVLLLICMHVEAFLHIAGTVFGMLSPFLAGAGIAFILSIPVGFFERRAGKSRFKVVRKLKRTISLLVTLLIIAGILTLVIAIVVPELVDTVAKIINTIPAFFSRTEAMIEKLAIDWKGLQTYVDELAIDWKNVGEQLVGLVRNLSSVTISGVFSFFQGFVQNVVNAGIAIIFSIYALYAKEKLARQARMLMQAFLKPAVTEWIVDAAYLAHKSFKGFFTGQFIEAIILGSMFVISMTIFQFPYAVLVGVLIFLVSMIPIIGALIGCVVGAFLILMVDPVRAVWFVVLFFCLQQIEGNLIYPRVVGSSVGLPALWILVAVTVGGSLFGILGILVFIPTVSVVYALIRKETMRRLAQKKNAAESA